LHDLVHEARNSDDELAAAKGRLKDVNDQIAAVQKEILAVHRKAAELRIVVEGLETRKSAARTRAARCKGQIESPVPFDAGIEGLAALAEKRAAAAEERLERLGKETDVDVLEEMRLDELVQANKEQRMTLLRRSVVLHEKQAALRSGTFTPPRRGRPLAADSGEFAEFAEHSPPDYGGRQTQLDAGREKLAAEETWTEEWRNANAERFATKFARLQGLSERLREVDEVSAQLADASQAYSASVRTLNGLMAKTKELRKSVRRLRRSALGDV
jgi:hypothetical protein